MLYGVYSGSSNTSDSSPQMPGLPQILSIIAVLIYSLFLGFSLMGNRVSPERSYLLIALPCLVPAIWYLVGFLRNEGGDVGLVSSSLGWFLVSLALFSKHLNLLSAMAKGLRPDQIPDTPITWIFALLAIAGIIGGAVLSGRYWMEKSS